MAKNETKIENKVEEEIIIDEDIIEEIEQIKSFETRVLDVYDDFLVIMVEGWRMGVYYDLPFKDLEWLREHKENFKGRNITVYYMGDLKNPHTLKYLPIKDLD